MYKLSGEIKIPGDKSVSHRALIFSAMSTGMSEIKNLLISEDIKATINILRNLGIRIIKKSDKWIVYGNGTNGFIQPAKKLNAMNSGTTARTMLGAVSSNPIVCEFEGDHSLSKRTMSRITVHLEKLGANIKLTKKDFLPIRILGSQNLIPQKIVIQKPSAQVKTSLIFAGLNIEGKLTIFEKKQTRDHTERLMDYLKIKYKREKLKNGSIKIELSGPYEIKPSNINVVGDPSSAAFFIVGAIIIPQSKVKIKSVMLNPTRIEFIKILKKMGAKIKIKRNKKLSGEDCGDIYAEYSKLKGININKNLAPFLIDEYPILSIAASRAKGKTTMNGIEELRHKESDRVKSIVSNLKRVGVKVSSTKDKIIIRGNDEILKKKCFIKSYNDHRISCTFMILNLLHGNKLEIDNEKCVSVSYPDFKRDLNKLKKKI